MDAEILSEIAKRLDAVESSTGTKVVFACESGSRAWGFASRDSDYDVRFIYLRPPTWYLSTDLERRRDVIELPIDGIWDINGWDLRKALQLLRKSNPPLIEWLQSPIVYREVTGVAGRLRELIRYFYSPKLAMYHYKRMADKNAREFLGGDSVWRKKYLYVLRPLLACRWIEQGRGPVPIEFAKLLTTVEDAQLLACIHELLDEKRAGSERSRGPAIPAINQFSQAELARLETATPATASQSGSPSRLDDALHFALREVWGLVLPGA